MACAPRHRHTEIVLCVAVALSLFAAGCSAASTESPTETTPAPTTSTSPDSAAAQPPTTTVPSTTTTTAPVPTEPVRGGTVTIGIDADLVFGLEGGDGVFRPPSLNPLGQDASARDVARLVVPGAFRLDGDTGELVPWLVEQIPRPANGGVVVDADGGVTVTYQVKEAAVWEDGTPITAADLAFTHELIVSADAESRVDGDVRRIHELVESGSVVADGKTLTLRLTAPHSAYERLFPWVLPAHAVDAATFWDDWNDRLWLSGAPFRLVSSEPPSDPEQEPGRIVLERNPTYWETDPATGEPLPYLDGIEVLAFTPGAMYGTAVTTFFTARAVDAMIGGLIRDFDRPYLGDPAEQGFEMIDGWDTLVEVMAFELRDGRLTVNPGSLNEHLAYRRAVLAAIDRQEVADTSGGLAISSLLGVAGVPGPDPWTQYDDPWLTGSLLGELGGELGRDFDSEAPQAVYVSSSGDETIAIGNAVVEQLGAAGFEATAQFDGDFFGTQWPEGLTDLYAFRMFAGTGGTSSLAENMRLFDPFTDDRFVVHWESVGEPATRYHDLMEEAATELDPDQLAALLAEAETILADIAVIYPLVRRQHTYRPYWPDRIQGMVPNRYQGWDTWNAAWWWSPAA